VVEHAHEEHEVELLARAGEVVDGHAPELDAVLDAELARGPLGLAQEERLDVDPTTLAPRRASSNA
jgi:hypothetical protein